MAFLASLFTLFKIFQIFLVAANATGQKQDGKCDDCDNHRAHLEVCGILRRITKGTDGQYHQRSPENKTGTHCNSFPDSFHVAELRIDFQLPLNFLLTVEILVIFFTIGRPHDYKKHDERYQCHTPRQNDTIIISKVNAAKKYENGRDKHPTRKKPY